jgi:hypothetical protein
MSANADKERLHPSPLETGWLRFKLGYLEENGARPWRHYLARLGAGPGKHLYFYIPIAD